MRCRGTRRSGGEHRQRGGHERAAVAAGKQRRFGLVQGSRAGEPSACTTASAAANAASCAAAKKMIAQAVGAVAPADAPLISTSVEPPVASTAKTVA